MAYPYDYRRDGNSVPHTHILEPTGGAAIATGSAVRVALPAQTGFCMVSTTVPIYFVFAPNATDTAGSSDPVLLPGSYFFRVPAGSTHLAVDAVSTEGTVSVLRMI